MIVRNEAHCLRRCLDSVRPLGAELIVVDTGSTDVTPAIAVEYGAEVTTFDFSRPDFAAARNQSLARANGRWVLAIDADETLRPSSVPLVQSIAACSDNVACRVRRYNHGTGLNPLVDEYIRLFPRRPEYRYSGRVHEGVNASIPTGGGVIVRTDVCIDHDFASDPKARRRKDLWYLRIIEEEAAADPNDLSRHIMLETACCNLGILDRAGALADRIVRDWPMDPEAHYTAGMYYLMYGANPARACSEFKTSLGLRPDDPTTAGFLQVAELSMALGVDVSILRSAPTEAFGSTVSAADLMNVAGSMQGRTARW